MHKNRLQQNTTSIIIPEVVHLWYSQHAKIGVKLLFVGEESLLFLAFAQLAHTRTAQAVTSLVLAGMLLSLYSCFYSILSFG